MLLEEYKNELNAEETGLIILHGVPEKLIWSNLRNPNNLYSIFEITVNKDTVNEYSINMVFRIPPPKLDVDFIFYGKKVNTEKYGLTFYCDYFLREMPINNNYTKEQLISFFSSNFFHGVGKKRATIIVEALGSEAIQKLCNDPDCLTRIKGLPTKISQQIYETISKNQRINGFAIQFLKWGIPQKLFEPIIKRYGDNALNAINENPYRLTYELSKVRFSTIDKIGEQLSFDKDCLERIESVIVKQLIKSYESEGNIYCFKENIINITIQYFGNYDSTNISVDLMNEILVQLEEKYKEILGPLIILDNKIILTKALMKEKRIAEILLDKRSKSKKFPGETMDRIVDFLVSQELDDQQCLAIAKALLESVSIIIGGPGTGKTTLIKSIVKLWYSIYFPLSKKSKIEFLCEQIVLLAPTGKAAKRIEESVQLYGSTIHRYLLHQESDKNNYEPRIFIIDEVSMLDIDIVYQLLETLGPKDSIVLIGDEHQLPPIGRGNFLNDILNSNTITTTRLENVYRQKSARDIVKLASLVNKKNSLELINFLKNKKQNISYHAKSTSNIQNFIAESYFQALKYYNYDFEKIQIISASNNGQTGVDELNKVIQDKLQNIDELNFKEITLMDTHLQINNRVMQKFNRPEKGVFNGEIGYILYENEGYDYEEVIENDKLDNLLETVIYSKPDHIAVKFDDRVIDYTVEELNELDLSYAITVHKSQGSEYDCVILVLPKNLKYYTTNNLIYTGITRAKEKLIIIDEDNLIIDCLANTPPKRNTYLKDLLNKNIDPIINHHIKERLFDISLK